MTSARPGLVHATRRAEQEAIAAIRTPTDAAAQAHRTLSLLHAARVRNLLVDPAP